MPEFKLKSDYQPAGGQPEAIRQLVQGARLGIEEQTMLGVTGAGKTFERWPEMVDNVIPYIGGEEEKSEQEPLKVWGKVENGVIVKASSPAITAQCLRVPVSNGHTAAVFVKFRKKVTKEQLAEVIDIDNFLLFEAVSYFAGNPDDVRNNYNTQFLESIQLEEYFDISNENINKEVNEVLVPSVKY